MKKLITSLVAVPLLLITANSNVAMSEVSRELNYNQEEDYKVSSFDIENSLLCSEKLNYEGVIDYIKSHEGYANGEAYTCVSGKLTIGYGHVIREGENFGSRISKQTADSLLRQDFRKAYKLTEKFNPELEGSRKLAIAHFIYSKGIGAFLRSGLRQSIKNNGNVDVEFAKWCYYTDYKTGNKVYSKVGAGIQKWETNMWHKDDELYAQAYKAKSFKF